MVLYSNNAYAHADYSVYVHYNLKLPDVYVGIVGWIYRTKIDPISTPYPCFLTFLSNGHPYIIFISQKYFFPYENVDSVVLTLFLGGQ